VKVDLAAIISKQSIRKPVIFLDLKLFKTTSPSRPVDNHGCYT